MTNSESDSERFEALSRELLKNGLSMRFEARGASMSPIIRDGQVVYVTPIMVSKLRKGDIVLTKGHGGFRVHRLVITNHSKNLFITRGDGGQQNDPPLRGDQILGVVVAKEVRLGRKLVRTKLRGISGKLLQAAAEGQRVLGKLLEMAGVAPPVRATSQATVRKQVRPTLGALIVLFLMLAASYARGQVAVDSTSSGSANLAGAGTKTLTFTHTTTATANRVLIVGVSINITNAPTTDVTGVTYDGTALSFVGAHNDAGDTRRVEMWYLLAPASGTNLPIVVSVDIPTAVTEGVVAGATTFTGVDQTVPLGSFVSADGAAGANSQLDVPSVVNGMVLDTLAIAGNQTITISGPQVSQWNLNSAGTANPGIRASGSSRTGAPSVPLSETFSGTSNWSLGAVSINPTAADIGVTTSVGSAVFLGQNTTYTITVFNNGTSAANAVKLSDTLASGMTLVSAIPSVGTCVTTTNPITCTIGTLASGTNAT
ncbi:MAG: S24 family peptidase, partial [Candidatus Sulfotelmatobacter sp.]